MGDSSGSSSSEEAVDISRIKRTTMGAAKRLKKNPMYQASTRSKAMRKHDDEATDEDQSSASTSSSDGEEEERRRAADIDFKYASSNTAESSVPKDMGATARSEVDTAPEQDYQAQFERVQKELKDEAGSSTGAGKEKIYRGLKMYGAREASDTTKGKASSGLNHYGPIRGTQFMRASVRWDYAPDICKDYKETGFCTFGDSCKFLHDRSDYKHGWEIERDWKKQQESKKGAAEEDYTIFSDDD